MAICLGMGHDDYACTWSGMTTKPVRRFASLTPTLRDSNPLQTALLRWYEANTTGISFAVGHHPYPTRFDGTNIWVANGMSNNVTRLWPRCKGG